LVAVEVTSPSAAVLLAPIKREITVAAP
jgi:hypothetical protein